MNCIFGNARNFTPDLSKWNVPTNAESRNMFVNAYLFNLRLAPKGVVIYRY